MLRLRGFAENGVSDPAPYQPRGAGGVSTLLAQSLATAPARVKTFPVIEIFGPTIQGEGAEAGLPTHFVRFGGCDYRCSWCDTMYAVDPAVVRATPSALSVDEIVERLDGARRRAPSG